MQATRLVAAFFAISVLGTGAADADPTNVSVDATRGYVDIELARLAILDARPADARRLVAEAAAAFDKAKGDPSVFTSSEAALLQPAAAAKHTTAAGQPVRQSPADAEAEAARFNAAKQENSAKVWAGGAPNDAAAAAANAAAEERAAVAARAAKQEKSARIYAGDAPRRWLPIEAEMGLDEDFAADPKTAAAVAEADARLAAGDRPGMIAALRRGGVQRHTVISIMPLDQTIADVHRAAVLVDDGKFFEASLLLRDVQDAVHYDVVDVDGHASMP